MSRNQSHHRKSVHQQTVFALSHRSSWTCSPQCKRSASRLTVNKWKTNRCDWTISPLIFLRLGSAHASVCHMRADCRVNPTFPSSTFQSRQSPLPVRLFPWQLPWQQPLLAQAPIHGMTLEWPLHGSLKPTNVDQEAQNSVIWLIIMMIVIGHFKLSDDN